jgi:predicted short-subunit dehydrogenase-like oxidoreductase (DUF2520 family)
MRVVIVGRGRVGSALGNGLEKAGHAVEIAGRDGPLPHGDVVIASVPDSAIASVIPRLPAGVPALHCAGSLGFEALRPHRPAGALHPLMTFPGPPFPAPELAGAGAAVEGDPEALEVALRLAADLGMKAFPAPRNRALYHAAAVIAGNFATVLLAEGARVLKAAGVEDGAALLAPLALQSIANAATDPRRAITGPAARGDERTLEAHRNALRDADMQDVIHYYDLLSAKARTLITGV